MASRSLFVRRPGAGGTPLPLLDYEPLSWELWIADASDREGAATLCQRSPLWILPTMVSMWSGPPAAGSFSTHTRTDGRIFTR